MAQSQFPEDVTKDFPPEESPNPIGAIIGDHIRMVSDLFAANPDEPGCALDKET